MVSRKGVAASIAATILFSSLAVSNLVIFSGTAENFRLVSLATEERAFHVQASLLTEVSALDLLDGAQEFLSSSHFTCSSSTVAVGEVVGAELVRLKWGSLGANSTMALSSDESFADNLTGLHPFNGSVAGFADLTASIVVWGNAPDRSVQYFRSEQHLLNLPLKLQSLTEHCLTAASEVSAALSGLGGGLCNSSALSLAEYSVANEVSVSAASDGFSVSVQYFILSTQPCRVGYLVVSQQANIAGPEGAFTFAEEEAGYVGA